MEFDNVPNAGGFTFNSSGASSGQSAFGFSIRPDGIVNYDSHVQTFNVPIILNSYGGSTLDPSSRVTINAAAGGFNFTGNWSGGVPNKATFDINGGILAFSGPGNVTIGSATTTGIIGSTSAGGSVEFNGTGTVTLNGTAANTFTGGVNINGQTVVANKANALGNGAPLVIRNNGVLQIGANNQSLGGGSVILGGLINGSSGIVFLTGSNNFQSGLGQAIFGGTGSVNKTGPNTFEFTRANTFSGGLNINGGTVKLSNTSGSGTGSGAVAINSGGTLSGTGFSTGPLTLKSGGTLAAGAPLGNLTVGSSTWFGGSTLVFTMNSASGNAGADPGWSTIHVNGALDLQASSLSKILIDITSLTLSDTPGVVGDFNPNSAYDWLFVSASGGINNFATTDFGITTSQFNNSVYSGQFSVTEENNNTEIHITYIPEPSTAVLALLGGFGIMLGLNFRRVGK